MTTKTSKLAADFQGTCQVCGRLQMLPKGLLSKHGYDVQWGFFNGVCWGADHLPFEQDITLVKKAIAQAAADAKLIRELSVEKRADRSPKNVELTVYAYDVRRADNGERLSSWDFTAEMGVKGSSVTVRGDVAKKGDEIEFRFTRRDVEYVVAFGFSKNVSARTTIDEFVGKINASEADSMISRAKQLDDYRKWQEKRIEGWKPHPEKLVPVDPKSREETVHAVNEYLSKKQGRDVALCSAYSARFRQDYKLKTKDRSKVTCKACLKSLAASDAQAAIEAKAKVVVDAMVSKYGDQVLVRWSDASKNATKEIRYHRKDLDKAVRQAACNQIDRGAK